MLNKRVEGIKLKKQNMSEENKNGKNMNKPINQCTIKSNNINDQLNAPRLQNTNNTSKKSQSITCVNPSEIKTIQTKINQAKNTRGIVHSQTYNGKDHDTDQKENMLGQNEVNLPEKYNEVLNNVSGPSLNE